MPSLLTYLKKRNLAVIAIGAVLVGYIAFLLMANYYSKIELQKSGLEQMRLDTEKYAVAVSYFFSEQKDHLKNLTEKRELTAFFENKALGMSMEYGLWDSVMSIAKVFDHFINDRRLGEDRIYTRIIFLESNGAVLVDRPADSANPANEQNWKRFLAPEHPDPKIIVEPQKPFWQIMVSIPYFYKGAFSGQVIAWISSDPIYRHMVKAAGGRASQRFFTIINDKGEPFYSPADLRHEGVIGDPYDFNELYASASREVHRFESSRENGSKVDMIAIRVPIPDMAFFLVAVAPAAAVFGHTSPRQLLAVLGILSLAILGGVAFIVFVNTRNLLLHARFEEASQRRQEVEDQNRQLEQEIRERQLAEQGRQESEEKYRLLVNQIPAMVFQGYGDWSIDPLDEKIEALTGYSKEDFESRRLKWCDLIPAEDLDYATEVFIEALKTDKSYVREHRLRKKNGEIIWVQCRGQIFCDAQGKVDYISGVSFDVTQRRQAEEALRKSEERFRDIAENTLEWIWEVDAAGKYTYASTVVEKLLGYNPQEILDKHFYDLFHPEDREKLKEAAFATFSAQQPFREFLNRNLRKNGEIVWLLTSGVPIIDDHGNLLGYRGADIDVTARRQAEEALKEGERFLANIFNSIQDGIIILDTDFNIIRVNPSLERWFAHAMPLVGKKCYGAFHGGGKPCKICPYRQTLETGKAAYKVMSRMGEDGGAAGWLEVHVFPIAEPATGKITGAIEYIRDITEQKQAEQALRQSEQQLRQAVKMEAVGRLAGGVAHDFNNILTGITGYCELLLMDFKDHDSRRHDVEEIKKAAERAASLTRQLLAFSRKQMLRMQPLDLNVVVANMDRMLKRIIGEDIELVSIPGPGQGIVKADLGQMEQVILNLAVNARDAMPQGGKLTIETAVLDLDAAYAQQHLEVQPGHYEMLAISDTGLGLDRETQARIFEPFFTTKEPGQGTGLGLSTVYGIIKQSHGHIFVYSEPGQGTTFKIYLPRLEDAVALAEPGELRAPSLPGTETILLVEDEDMVRQVARRILERNGYTVKEAGLGAEALLLSGQNSGPIHLLLTDVVMPGMSGRELAELLTQQRPGIKVLYMSGHTENAIVHHGVLEEGIAFIQKPFRHDLLVQKVREVLDRPPPGPA